MLLTAQGGTGTLDRLRRMRRIFTTAWQTTDKLKAGAKNPRFTHEEMNGLLSSWGNGILDLMNLDVTVVGTPEKSTPHIFVGNHISYLDIPLLMAKAPVVFVAKKQIGQWPIFGTACRNMGVAFVDRDAKDSRGAVAYAVAKTIRDRKQSVVLFPSGTTCIDERKHWRWGAFKIAQLYGIPIQPFRLRFTPLRTAAYIDDDTFAPHLWRLMREKRIETYLEFHPPVMVTDPEQDCDKWYHWSRAALIP